MSSFDPRFLLALFLLSLVLFKLSKIRTADVRFMLWFTFAFCLLNNLLIFLFSPQHGTEIYGSCHEIFHIAGRYTLTQEQLLYHANVFLKYAATIPIVLLFVTTTDPSEFASSLNRIGVNYKIAYSVSLALRYIPDIQREYHDITLSLQARGIEMSTRAHVLSRLRNMGAILFPLVFTSMEKIDTVTNAMELRGFGKHRRRTWYSARKLQAADWAVIAATLLFSAAALVVTFHDGSRFWNPFAQAG